MQACLQLGPDLRSLTEQAMKSIAQSGVSVVAVLHSPTVEMLVRHLCNSIVYMNLVFSLAFALQACTTRGLPWCYFVIGITLHQQYAVLCCPLRLSFFSRRTSYRRKLMIYSSSWLIRLIMLEEVCISGLSRNCVSGWMGVVFP